MESAVNSAPRQPGLRREYPWTLNTGSDVLMRSLRPLAAIGLLVVSSALIAGCGTTDRSADPSPSTTASSTPTPECWKSPMTGTCSNPDAPVLIVKIDDVIEARPQFHLNQADLVLVEPVEGGLTRLFAVYNTTLPETVGPIRSARITDTDLAPMFGDALFAYSGSQGKLVPYLKNTQMQMVGAPQGGTGYSRLSDRRAPHNYVANVSELLTRVDDTATARLASASYWKIAEAQQVAGTAVTKVLVHWPAAEKSYIWDAANKRWNMDVYTRKLLTQIDATGTTERAHASNIVIMQSELQDSEFGDKFGAHTPYPQTIGSGAGIVLVDGKLIDATWKRATMNDLPHWFDATGNEIALRPGNTWWLIVTDLSNVRPTVPVVDTATATAK